MRTKLVLLVVLALSLLVVGIAAAQGAFDLSWRTVDGGGGNSTGGEYALSGTVGQADAGTMAGGAFALAGGFWPGTAGGGPQPQPPGAIHLPVLLRNP